MISINPTSLLRIPLIIHTCLQEESSNGTNGSNEATGLETRCGTSELSRGAAGLAGLGWDNRSSSAAATIAANGRSRLAWGSAAWGVGGWDVGLAGRGSVLRRRSAGTGDLAKGDDLGLDDLGGRPGVDLAVVAVAHGLAWCSRGRCGSAGWLVIAAVARNSNGNGLGALASGADLGGDSPADWGLSRSGGRLAGSGSGPGLSPGLA